MKRNVRLGLLLLLCVLWMTGSFSSQSDAAQALPFDVATDLVYYDGPGFNPEKHVLDVFQPRGVEQAPVLVFVYGGGWQEGDKAYYPYIGRTFTRAGFTTVVINYRLTPEVQHPGHIEDVARAFAWVRANISQYGGDPEQIFLTGHSAGGHLISLLALNERFLDAHGLSVNLIRGVIPISGVFDLSDPRDGLNLVFSADPDLRRDASPIVHVAADAPPFLLVVAEYDLEALIVQADQMLAALVKQGVQVELIQIPGKDHLTIVGHIGRDGDATTQAVIDFVREHSQNRAQ